MYMYIVCMYHFPLEVHVRTHSCQGHHQHSSYMRILKHTHVHVCNCSYIYTLCTPIPLQMRCQVIMYYGSLLSQWHNRLRIGPALSFTLVYSQLMPLVHNTIRYTCSSPTCREIYIHTVYMYMLDVYTCTPGFHLWGVHFWGSFKSRSCVYTYIYLYCVVFHRLAWRRRHTIC